MKNYNRAVLGTGVIANVTAAAMLENGRNLFAVGNRTHGKAVAFAEKYNIGRVYDSYDELKKARDELSAKMSDARNTAKSTVSRFACSPSLP